MGFAAEAPGVGIVVAAVPAAAVAAASAFVESARKRRELRIQFVRRSEEKHGRLMADFSELEREGSSLVSIAGTNKAFTLLTST